MKASIVKLIFQVHQKSQKNNFLEFDEQVIVLPILPDTSQVEEALNWAKKYEIESNEGVPTGLRWEFIGIKEIFPFHLESKPLALCSGTLRFEENQNFKEHIRLKSKSIEEEIPLFL